MGVYLPEVELQMGRIRVALEERLRSPELSVDEAVNSRGPHGPQKCTTKFRLSSELSA